MCQGFNHFSGLLHHFVLAKLATSSIRVNSEATGRQVYVICMDSFLNDPGTLNCEQGFLGTTGTVDLQVPHKNSITLFVRDNHRMS